jgi:sulfopyruvate decarboxylase TPP-binding subunit
VTPVAQSVPAETIAEAIRAAGITHAVTVPDTHQQTLLAALDDDQDPVIVRAGTEDDVLGICVGLWIAGMRPLAVIQQLGLFASVNALRWMRHEALAPVPILAGMFGRDINLAVDADPRSAVRLCPPLLDVLAIPWALVEGPQDAGAITAALRSSDPGPRVVLLGAPTS